MQDGVVGGALRRVRNVFGSRLPGAWLSSVGRVLESQEY